MLQSRPTLEPATGSKAGIAAQCHGLHAGAGRGLFFDESDPDLTVRNRELGFRAVVSVIRVWPARSVPWIGRAFSFRGAPAHGPTEYLMAAKRNTARHGVRHKTVESTTTTAAPLRVSELSGRTLQVVNHMLSSIAFDQYGDHCSMVALAKAFNSTPGLLRPAIHRLVESGLVTIEGSPHATVYPTVKLLMQHNSRLSLAADAQEIIRRLRRM